MSLQKSTLFKAVVTMAVFAILMVIARIYNVYYYWFDATYYIGTADPVYANGFHILQFPETFRGYFFMVLYSGLKILFARFGVGPHWAWRVMVNFMVAVMTVCFLPEVFAIFGERRRTKRTYLVSLVAFIALLMIYWGMFIQHILSDMPSAFFFFGGYYFLLKWLREEYGWKSWLYGFLSGLFLYAAYNTRVVLLYGIILGFVAFVIHIVRVKEYKKLLCTITMIVGITIIAIPQMMINYHYRGTYTPRVLTEQFTGYDHNLQAQQLYWGLMYSHYETYVGDLDEYHGNGMPFEDLVGQDIIAREGIGMEGFSYGTILKLFMKYPLDMIGVYVRHILGVMTPPFLETYITNAFSAKGLHISLCILLWLLAGVAVIMSEKWKKNLGLTLCLILAAVIPGVLQSAGAAETRFIIQAHILLYYYLAFVVDYKVLWQNVRRRIVPVVCVCAFIFLLWISNIGMILSTNSLSTMLIHDGANHLPQQIEESE